MQILGTDFLVKSSTLQEDCRAYPKRAVANDRNGLSIQPVGATPNL